jgi:hypothetical protein
VGGRAAAASDSKYRLHAEGRSCFEELSLVIPCSGQEKPRSFVSCVRAFGAAVPRMFLGRAANDEGRRDAMALIVVCPSVDGLLWVSVTVSRCEIVRESCQRQTM